MYTVMMAAMHRHVIAVDPIIKNLALINLSLNKAGNSQYVSFINNPIRLVIQLLSFKNVPKWIISYSDAESLFFPVTNNAANEGNTRLVSFRLMTPSLKDSISGDPVVSTTLDHLVEFEGAREAIIKIDVEVSYYQRNLEKIHYCRDLSVKYCSPIYQNIILTFLFLTYSSSGTTSVTILTTIVLILMIWFISLLKLDMNHGM